MFDNFEECGETEKLSELVMKEFSQSSVGFLRETLMWIYNNLINGLKLIIIQLYADKLYFHLRAQHMYQQLDSSVRAFC